jgi:hypothetical protein
MKEFVGRKMTKKLPFMDGEVEVKVLTVADAKEIEAKTKKAKEDDPKAQLDLLRFVIRKAVIGAEDLTDDEIDDFPVTELTKLSEGIMGVEAPSEQGND